MFQYRMIGGGGPKLWLSLYTFDDRGRIEQMVQSAELYEEEEMESVRLPDGSAALIGQVHAEKDQTKGISVHGVKINFALVDPAVTAMLVCLNGGPRSFNHVNTATVRVASSPGDRGEGTFLAGSGSSAVFPLFSSSARTRKDCLDIAVLVLFKDGWDEDGVAKWAAVPVFEPIFQTITRAKEAFCSQVVISVVPCLEICRPRMFPSGKQYLPILILISCTDDQSPSISIISSLLFPCIYSCSTWIMCSFIIRSVAKIKKEIYPWG